MKNVAQCTNGLEYNSFSIVHVQTRCSDDIKSAAELEQAGGPVARFDDPVASEIFTYGQQNMLHRYHLPGFHIRIELSDSDKKPMGVLKGQVHVRAVIFNDACLQLSYRLMVVPGGKLGQGEFCDIDAPFDTDRLIVAAATAQGAEHWDMNLETGRQTIDGALGRVVITGFPLDETSGFDLKAASQPKTMQEAMARYAAWFEREPHDENASESIHTFIDVSDNVGHLGENIFETMDEEAIIEHIETCHRAELVGLMSLYPFEWPYRMEHSYLDVCGRNIAIDTDDLVLANQNLTLVMGTYGKRGEEASTDWKKHLAIRETYHVCWPEYLTIVKIILAKKQIINYAIGKYVNVDLSQIDDKRLSWRQRAQRMLDLIRQNAVLSSDTTSLLRRLDPMRHLRFAAHRHMFALTEQRLGVVEDERYLREVSERIDHSLSNANDSLERYQSQRSNRILMVISLATLFGVLLQNKEVPLFTQFFSEQTGLLSGAFFVLVTLAIIGVVTVELVRQMRKTKKR